MIIFTVLVLALGLIFFVGGVETKETNVTMKSGEKTTYEIPWYITSILFFIMGTFSVLSDIGVC